MTHRIEPFFFFFFLDMTHRIEPFLQWLKELNSFFFKKRPWLKELKLFSIRLEIFVFQTKIMSQRIQPFGFQKKNSRNWSFFFGWMTQRFFKIWLSELNFFFQMWLTKKWIFFERYSKNWTLFIVLKHWTSFSNKTPRIEPFFNTTQRFCSFNMTQIFLNMTQRIEFFLKKKKNFSFLNMTHLIELFLDPTDRIEHFLNTPQRIELISWIWRKELNPLFLEYDEKNWTVWFLKTTHRIEPSFFVTQRIELFLEHGSRNWPFLYKKKPLRLEPFFSLNMTQRIEPFFWYDLENWTTFSKWRKELNLLFLEYDAKNWTLFQIWRKELDPFSNMTPRNDFFFVRLQELNPFKYDSKILFFKYDSKIDICLHMTQSIEHLFQIWLKELNTFFL